MWTVVVRVHEITCNPWWVKLKCWMNSINIPWYISVAKIIDYFLCCKPYVSSNPSSWFFRLCAIISVYACQPWENKFVLHQWAFQKGRFWANLQTCLWATSLHFSLKWTLSLQISWISYVIKDLGPSMYTTFKFGACGCKCLFSVLTCNDILNKVSTQKCINYDFGKAHSNCVHKSYIEPLIL